MMPRNLSLREQDDADADAVIVRRAHASDPRWAMMATWPVMMVAALRDQQQLAQERHLAALHPHADKLMILVDGIAVGRIVVDRNAGSWHLVDLALIAEAQGVGIGTAVLRRLLGDAARTNVGVGLEVGVDNPRADVFYRRLGFMDAPGGNELQRRLRWEPPTAGRRKI